MTTEAKLGSLITGLATIAAHYKNMVKQIIQLEEARRAGSITDEILSQFLTTSYYYIIGKMWATNGILLEKLQEWYEPSPAEQKRTQQTPSDMLEPPSNIASKQRASK